MNNESSLLINSLFALRKQNLKPVFTHIETTERPYTDSEIDELMSQQLERDKKAGLPEKRINHHGKLYLKFLREHNKKIEVKKDYPIDLHNTERIIITPNGKGYISTAFIDFAKANSIAIYWIDSKGKVDASFLPFNFKRPSLIIKQVESRINGKALEITKYLIKLKLESQGMKDYIPKLNKALDIKEIMQIEAISANLYFKNWVFGKEWNWKGRHGKVSGNKNAVDPINSMLNLGYSLLAQRMSELLLKRGFELSIGFMHQNEAQKPYWNMLVYDFIEPYRVWIDSQVIEMILGLRIKPTDFTFTKDKMSMTFKDNAFDIALNEFMFVLNPLELKSLPLIRKIEKML
ncbi:MAG: CRISPR-associated endonuclease Cas1 [Candidatus Methanoperedens sp.]